MLTRARAVGIVGVDSMARARGKRSRLASLARALRRLLLALLILGTLAAAAAAALVYSELTAALPSVERLAQHHLPTATQVLADDGTLIGEFFVQKRYVVPIDRIPAVVRNAFVAAEDAGFYRHAGVDVVSIGRAFINNALGTGPLQGGSTITQQVVKSLLLTPKKSYERKLKEVVLALRLEQQLSKDEILSLYLNHIYLGSGAYGVAAAARAYFGKTVEEVSLAEAALLAGLPQAPSRYSPLKHWQRAKTRQQYVLRRMVEAGFISLDDYDTALATPLALAPRHSNYLAAPYYVEHVRRLLEERYGTDALYQLGLRVHTAANVAWNTAAAGALRAALEELDREQGLGGRPVRRLGSREIPPFLQAQARAFEAEPLHTGSAAEAVVSAVQRGQVQVQIGNARGVLERPDGARPAALTAGDVIRVEVAHIETDGRLRVRPDPQPLVQGALLAMEPGTGMVKAMVGGYDFSRSHFNRAVQAARQPGSAFKPFVYAAALDRRYTPASIIVDEPISFPDNDGWWSPQNYEERFFGPTTLREALTFSRNVVTVKLANSIGLTYLTSFVQRFGFQQPMPRNLSLALGSSEVTLLELSAAYSAFANLGRRAQPIFITRIVDNGGRTIFAAEPALTEVMPAATAFQITSILQNVIERGTGKRASALRRPAAGKTGTTNDLHDAWFMGYTPELLAGVWIGFDEKRSLGGKRTGGRVAAPIWLSFMQQALEGRPIQDFPVPSGIVLTSINPQSGERAMPGDAGAVLEAFRRGTEPTVVAAAYTAPDSAAEIAARDFFRNED
jgi:penicillin-binding protein 1A